MSEEVYECWKSYRDKLAPDYTQAATVAVTAAILALVEAIRAMPERKP